MHSFDEVYESAGASQYYGEPSRSLQRMLDLSATLGLLTNGDRAMDLGCGDGRNAIFMASRGLSVEAIDTSKAGVAKLLDVARSERLSLRAAVASMLDWQPPDGHYQLIVASTVLEHLEVDEREMVAKNICAGLALGGLLYCKVFLRHPNPQVDCMLQDSPTSFAVISRPETGWSSGLFPELSTLFYVEKLYRDEKHGDPHTHYVCEYFGAKLGADVKPFVELGELISKN